MAREIHILLYLLFTSITLHASEGLSIKGRTLNVKTGEKLAYVAVNIPELGIWITSNSDGVFQLNDVDLTEFTVRASCLGMEAFVKGFSLRDLKQHPLIIQMIPITYDMEEVLVIAVKGTGIGTSTSIGRAAIEHVQPTSLSEIIQLVPGNVMLTNPNLSKVQQITLREIGYDRNSAMGTTIIVDGAPVFNDANMQTLGTAYGFDNFNTTVGAGVDLRQIATDNIESIEVITGIPSVAYGNLTSGAVLVTTKTGYTPYEVKLKTDPNIKQVAFGKGILMKSGKSAVNFDLEYLQSFSDLRSKYQGFDRLSGGLSYSNTFCPSDKPLSMTIKGAYFQTVDQMRTDPEAMVLGEKITAKDLGGRFNIFGKWLIKNQLLTNINYKFSTSFTHQISSEERYRTSRGIQIISLSDEAGINEGVFLPSEQFSAYSIDGKPVSVFAQLSADKLSKLLGIGRNRLFYGLEYSLNGNIGDGQVYDLTNPPFVSSYTSRPRKFKDVPVLSNYALFAEENLNVNFGHTNLLMQAGIRLNNFQNNGFFKSEIGFYSEPRFNARYRFLNKQNNVFFDEFAINFGAGKTIKSPTLHHLYPDPAYFDLSMLQHYTSNPDFDLSVIDTRIYDTRNRDLKPAHNIKVETGVDFKIKSVYGNITAFYERLSNGYGFSKQYVFVPYNRYDRTGLSPDSKPILSELTTIADTSIVAYEKPLNKSESVKRGIEFSFNLGRIRRLATSFVLDGAWLQTERIISTEPIQFQPSSASVEPYAYVGIYPAGQSKISERFNTTLRMVTQIPKLRLILSSTLQVIWINKYAFPIYDEAPTSLLFADGKTMVFTRAMRTMPEYVRFVNEKTSKYYLTESMPPVALFNLRLSKEVKERLRFSFYVNNVINNRPSHQYIRTGGFVRSNPSIYFGAEMTIKL